ncbi:MAG: hypothetical protein J5527_08185 [Treponema sp.]|nr:hypothetical protein [Treponema sp.]
MILTVSPHAMWGLKAALENNEKLDQSINYTLILDDKTKPIVKYPNKCFEFINSSIQNWIIINKLNEYTSNNPPKFSATLESNTIKIIKRIK